MSLPLDVRLMNLASSVLVGGFVLLAAASAALWWLRSPGFTVAGVTLLGEVTHSNEVTVRANLLPHLNVSVLTLDLEQARAQFEALPWVRRAVVRREFPNRLRVHLQEHHAAAYWGEEDETRLVNDQGEIFEANLGEVEKEGLPRLVGPNEQAALMLNHYRMLRPLLQTLELDLVQLELSPRGSWRAVLDNGAVVEIGQGDGDTLRERVQRFVSTVTQAASKHQRRVDAVESADLRYPHGYALHLQGVSTVNPPNPKN